MEAIDPQPHGPASSVNPHDVTTCKRPGAPVAPTPKAAREPGWIVMTSSSTPTRADATRKRSRAPSFAPRRERHLKVSPTWQPRVGASLEAFYPWDNPLYPRIPKAPKLPSEFDRAARTTPSTAPQAFEDGGLDLDLDLDHDLDPAAPSMWPAVRRVWTWLRGGDR
ncbi:MAG: hypothetical protein ABJE95_29300 [Byssovorax sp.]